MKYCMKYSVLFGWDFLEQTNSKLLLFGVEIDTEPHQHNSNQLKSDNKQIVSTSEQTAGKLELEEKYLQNQKKL